MKTRNIKRRLVKARIALNQTVQKILDINRKRKNLLYMDNATLKKQKLEKELRLLNKLAEHQAVLIKKYEKAIQHAEEVSENASG